VGARIVPPARSSNDSAWDNRGDYVSIIGFDIDGGGAGSGAEWTHSIYTGGSYSVIEGNHVHDLATGIRYTGLATYVPARYRRRPARRPHRYRRVPVLTDRLQSSSYGWQWPILLARRTARAHILSGAELLSIPFL